MAGRPPLGDAKFFFFIFALIPVQTLFTYNWLILPQYLERAFEGGFVSDRFELFANLNPILIFVAVPMVTALTMKKKVYNMMVIGTAVMAAPAFLLAAGTSLPLLLGFLFIMTIGEAMWQPRFLQYAAEIAPEDAPAPTWAWRSSVVPDEDAGTLYSGVLLQSTCRPRGRAIPDHVALLRLHRHALADPADHRQGWVGKDFKTKS
ncbi:MAG: hypothetical protein R3D98_12705 [Candidatus Krumholzibacteriia bacterium]